MKLIFWQNIISPHQMDFLDSLAKVVDVTLVVEREIDDYRANQNWSTKVSPNIVLVVSPSINQIYKLINNNNEAHHIFSGFFAYKKISFAMMLALWCSKKVYLISENVAVITFRNKLIYLFRKFMAGLFKKSINTVFVTGKNAFNYFIELGFKRNQLSAFGYFIDVGYYAAEKNTNLNVINVVFIGRLIESKGIEILVNSFDFLGTNSCEYRLDVVGAGPLKERLFNISNNQNKNISFKGLVSREEALRILSGADLLVLPNIGKEGWGAVVNESLLLGVPVICSSYTGACVLIDEPIFGSVLTEVNTETIAKEILLYKKPNRKLIKKMAESKISTSVVAKYFVEVIETGSSDLAPWKIN